jgi:NADPH-dependent ferric siderophore reductase
MIDTSERPEYQPAAHDARPRRPHSIASRRRRAARVSDGVIAAYIHELRGAASPRARGGRSGDEAALSGC